MGTGNPKDMDISGLLEAARQQSDSTDASTAPGVSASLFTSEDF